MSRQQFYLYLRHSQRFINKTTELRNKINAPPNLREYEVETYGNAVIDYYNDQFKNQHKFKLFVFGAYGDYKPLYRYGPDDYTKPLVLYDDNKHFDGVRNPNELFGQNYCLACEMPYDRASYHTMKCKQRCNLCSGMGPSFPCKSDNKFKKQCKDCKKTFKNEDCFKRHKDSRFCQLSHKCLDCGITYNVNDVKKKGRNGHFCHEHFCNVCHVYHNPSRGFNGLPLFFCLCHYFYSIYLQDVISNQSKRENNNHTE